MENGKAPARRLILLDVDGVIVDSFDLLYCNLSQLIKTKLNRVLTIEEYREFFRGNPLQEILKYIGLRSLMHLQRADLEQVFLRYDTCRIYDGMVDLICSLAKQSTICVVTSSSIEVVKPKFVAEGLDACVTAYLGSETDMHKDKKIRLAMSEFGFEPADTWFVTDTSGDLVEAHKTGIHTIGATWGYHSREWLEETHPEHIVETPQALSKLLLT